MSSICWTHKVGNIWLCIHHYGFWCHVGTQELLDRFHDLFTWARMKAKPKKSQSISLVRGTICDIHFCIGGNIIPTVREQPVESLGRLYAFPLTDRHRGVEVLRTALEGLHAIEKSELPGKLKAWCSSMVSYPVSCGPCRSKRFPSPGLKPSNSTSTSTSASGWVCPPASQQLASIPWQECSSSPSRPSQKSSRLEKLGSTWCFGTRRTTSYAKYSLKSELEPSGQLLKRWKKQKPASRSKKSLEPPRPDELV